MLEMTLAGLAKGAGVVALAAGLAGAALDPDFSLDPAIDDYTGIDTTSGSTVEQVSTSNPRRFLFRIDTASASRAEIRRSSQLTGSQSMGGVFILNNQSGDRLSIIQALNVREQGSPTGGSEPVGQLAVRKTGAKRTVDGESRDVYEFYIVQQSGQPACTNLGTFTKTERIAIRMTYAQNGRPIFYKRVNGRNVGSCTGGDPDRTMGNPEGPVQGTYYYGKLGVYKTSSGTGSASVTWDAVYD